jgi:hypothetical protein
LTCTPALLGCRFLLSFFLSFFHELCRKHSSSTHCNMPRSFF